ncbi:glycosyltransferase family 2 protein [Candidatus Parcubacteria bacterium]|nr:glycosyltransferase family 2 protein [Patescibacteria group bacterium]MBU4380834.1 glycosyltransferase family 2 protein [Patescibacteria group bacterium]MCG2689499.1 glycosyltransferase family 2 protein [Candidatus Parcubacteria bacterium]
MYSIVVPVYNEEKAVKDTIDRVYAVCKSMGEKFEVIAVNDGSKDSSLGVLQAISYDEFRVLNHTVNKGYGASLKDGIKLAKYDQIAICDADGTYPIERIPELLAGLTSYDMVVGKRIGRYKKTPFIKSAPKFILDQVANLVVGRKIEDINSGLRAFRKTDITPFFNLISDRFSFTTTSTLSYMSNGLSVKYIPIEYDFRKGVSKVKAKDGADFLFLILRTVMYFNPLRFFLWPALGLMGLGFVKFVYDLFVEPYLNITTSSMLFFLAGLQILAIGMLADLIVRTKK